MYKFLKPRVSIVKQCIVNTGIINTVINGIPDFFFSNGIPGNPAFFERILGNSIFIYRYTSMDGIPLETQVFDTVQRLANHK